MTWIEKQLGEWIVNHRWRVIVATLLMVGISSGGIGKLTVTNDTRVFFSEENPQLQALEALENTYNKVDNILFAVAPRDGNVFSRETLSAIVELTEASWQIPYSNRVDSITNFQHTRSEEDDLLVEDLVENPEELSAEDLQFIKKIALADPRLVGQLISAAAHVTAVNINILLPGKSLDEVPEAANYARKLAAEFREKYPHLDIYITGAIMFDNAFAEAGIMDMKTLVPLMFLTLLLLIGLTLRSFAATIATSIVIIFSALTAMGLAGWLNISLTAASVTAPTLILTLAVADSVHLLATMLQQMRSGMTKNKAIAESIRINLQPVFLTSITTAIGFLSMNFSDAPPFRDLGNIVAMGVSAAFIYSVTMLPAMMTILPVRVRTGGAGDQCKSCSFLATFVIKRRRAIFRTMLLAIVVLAAGNFRIELNDDFVKYFDESFDIRIATDFVEQDFRGFDIIEYSLDSGEPGGISNPEYLKNVEAFTNWYRQHPKVTHVRTYIDTIKQLNKNMNGDDPAYYSVPISRDLAAQYLLLYEMSLPFGHDLNNLINIDKSATRMIVFFKDVTSRELREQDKEARIWFERNAPSMFTYGSGLSIIWAHISQRNINNMLFASFGALMLISIILIFALRTFKLGLLSLIPNLAPALMAFGIWGLTKGMVGLGLSVVVAMTLGIVVDDTIHFMSKYLRARREQGISPTDAVHYAFDTVGTAMWVTTVALTAGFFILTLSGYKMNADMGLLTALTITLALALDFLFLPVLLMKADNKQDI